MYQSVPVDALPSFDHVAPPSVLSSTYAWSSFASVWKMRANESVGAAPASVRSFKVAASSRKPLRQPKSR